MIFDSFREARETQPKKEAREEKTFEFMLKSIGLSVKIIKHPVDCDFDKSATIDFWEASYLAFLLSIDAVCRLCVACGRGQQLVHNAHFGRRVPDRVFIRGRFCRKVFFKRQVFKRKGGHAAARHDSDLCCTDPVF